MEAYQYLSLSNGLDTRIFFNSLLASIRGASTQYGLAKKQVMRVEQQYLNDQIYTTNQLIIMKLTGENKVAKRQHDNIVLNFLLKEKYLQSISVAYKK